jgi:farnesyl-diphosphate farnesyltransferase
MEKLLRRRLLRKHARTFALTLDLLPRSLREPLGIAYLLARASDTIADSHGIPAVRRLAVLRGLALLLESADPGPWPSIDGEGYSPSQEELIRALPHLLSALDGRTDRGELLLLWRTILRGQIFDLERIGPGVETLGREELEHYCDLVAGSVGVVWTRLIAMHAPGTLRRPVSEMEALGAGYGRGLQFVNILRDRAEDRLLGRCYLGGVGFEEASAMARRGLSAGMDYVAALTPGRIRLASRLPLDLAIKTLETVVGEPQAERVRLSRRQVHLTLVRALPSLWLPSSCNPAS